MQQVEFLFYKMAKHNLQSMFGVATGDNYGVDRVNVGVLPGCASQAVQSRGKDDGDMFTRTMEVISRLWWTVDNSNKIWP